MARIIVADDEDAALMLTSSILIQVGYEVLTASNGKAALEALKGETIDLVITDLIMPSIDGLQVISTVRSHYPECKVIAMSGGDITNIDSYMKLSIPGKDKLAPDQFLSLAAILGADDIIVKPFQDEELLEKVSDLIR